MRRPSIDSEREYFAEVLNFQYPTDVMNREQTQVNRSGLNEMPTPFVTLQNLCYTICFAMTLHGAR